MLSSPSGFSRSNQHEKSYKIIITYYIGYVTIKILSYVKINKVNPLFFVIDKVDGYIKECNGNKYLAPVSTDKTKRH